MHAGFILNMNFVNNSVSTTCKYDSDRERKVFLDDIKAQKLTKLDESIFNKVLNTGFILNMNFVNNNVSTTCKYDSDSEEKFRKILKLSNIILYYFFLQNAIHDFKFRRENSK